MTPVSEAICNPGGKAGITLNVASGRPQLKVCATWIARGGSPMTNSILAMRRDSDLPGTVGNSVIAGSVYERFKGATWSAICRQNSVLHCPLSLYAVKVYMHFFTSFLGSPEMHPVLSSKERQRKRLKHFDHLFTVAARQGYHLGVLLRQS